MLYKLLCCSLLSVLVCGCDKPARQESNVSSESSPPRPTPLDSFEPVVYRTGDRTKSVSLISVDELEIRKDSVNLICKYTKTDDSIRAVANVAGTKQAFYFKIRSIGLRDSEGSILLSPKDYEQGQETLLSRKQDQRVFGAIGRHIDPSQRVNSSQAETASSAVSAVQSAIWPLNKALTIGNAFSSNPSLKRVDWRELRADDLTVVVADVFIAANWVVSLPNFLKEIPREHRQEVQRPLQEAEINRIRRSVATMKFSYYFVLESDRVTYQDVFYSLIDPDTEERVEQEAVPEMKEIFLKSVYEKTIPAAVFKNLEPL